MTPHQAIRLDWYDKSDKLTNLIKESEYAYDLLDYAKSLDKAFKCAPSKATLLIAKGYCKELKNLVKQAHLECAIAKRLFQESCVVDDEQTYKKLREKLNIKEPE